MIITSNHVAPVAAALIDSWGSVGATISDGTDQLNAINVLAGQDDPGYAVISNNNISAGFYDSTRYGFFNGIRSQVSGAITGNTIRGFQTNTAGAGIGISAALGSTSLRGWTITDNNIFRDTATEDIQQYIFLESVAARGHGVCSGNVFNSPYINIASNDDETINGTGTGVPLLPYATTWNVFNNKNQTDITYVRCGGQVSIQDPLDGAYVVSGPLQGNAVLTYAFVDAQNGTQPVACEYLDLNNQIALRWDLPLFGTIPNGTVLVELNSTFSLSGLGITEADGIFLAGNQGGSSGGSTIDVTTGGTTTSRVVTWTPPADTYFAQPGKKSTISALFTLTDNASFFARIGEIEITYRW